MKFEKLQKIIEENQIPNDVELLSDSGWECCATNMDAIFYNPTSNTIVFTQGYKSHVASCINYVEDPGWVLLFNKGEGEN